MIALVAIAVHVGWLSYRNLNKAASAARDRIEHSQDRD
jgi:hypothetical protein